MQRKKTQNKALLNHGIILASFKRISHDFNRQFFLYLYNLQKKKNWSWLKKNRRLLIRLVITGIIIGAAICIYPFDWAGFKEDSNKSETIKQIVDSRNGGIIELKETTKHFQSAKTVWDWLGLAGTFLIPLAIYEFQHSEQERAEAISHEEALLAYFKHISERLIDKELKKLIDKDSNDLMRDAALDEIRACTLSLLWRLNNDGERKGRVIRFLSDAELISKLDLELAELSRANLSNVKLKCAKLGYANLSNADLSLSDERIINKIKTDLDDPNLIDKQKNTLEEFIDDGIQLYCANLKKANLSERFLKNACLRHAILKDAILENVKLSSADLTSADLRGAKLYGADLKDAKLCGANLTGAILPNGEKYEYPKQLEQFGVKVDCLPEEAKCLPK